MISPSHRVAYRAMILDVKKRYLSASHQFSFTQAEHYHAILNGETDCTSSSCESLNAKFNKTILDLNHWSPWPKVSKISKKIIGRISWSVWVKIKCDSVRLNLFGERISKLNYSESLNQSQTEKKRKTLYHSFWISLLYNCFVFLIVNSRCHTVFDFILKNI